MNKRASIILPAMFALLFSFSGCVSLWSQNRSGFLADYSSLEPDPNQKGIFYFRNPQKDSQSIAEKHPAVMIAPIVVYFDSDIVGLAVSPNELQSLTDGFKQDLTAALAKKHTVVDKPGPNVARIRIAFSGIVPSRFRLSPHPSLTAVDLGKASLEAEIVDSITAERISALMDTRNRTGYVKLDKATIRKHAGKVIGDWVNLVSDWLGGLYPEPEPASEPPTGDPESDPAPGIEESKP